MNHLIPLRAMCFFAPIAAVYLIVAIPHIDGIDKYIAEIVLFGFGWIWHEAISLVRKKP